jgi:glutamate carboxypeptidase
MDHVGKIQQYLEAHRQDMVIFLKQLVDMETPSMEIEAQHKILSFLKAKLEHLGYFTLQLQGDQTGGYLYARPRKRNKSLPLQLLVGHSDTVWPIETIAEMPVKESLDKIKGPGIYDMKSGLTQLIFALQAIRDLNLPMEVVPIILINSDEEIGSRESSGIIKTLAKLADRAYVLEPPLGLEGKLKTARKGLGRFTITVKGKAAHAGLDPDKGINAIVELSHQVQKLYAMNDTEKGITVNIGMIEGGISPNVVAPESKAVIDVRVLTASDGVYVTEKIRGLKPHLPETELLVEGGIGRPPMEKTVQNQRLWEMALDHGNHLGIDLQQATAGGGSDANTTSLYTATLDGLGTPGDGAHASHEFILRNKMVERTALLTLLMIAEPLNRKS